MIGANEGSDDPRLCFFRGVNLRLFQIAICVSILIAVIPESAISTSTMAQALSSSVGQAIPAIERMRSVAPLPATTALLFAVNWLFVPGYLVLFFLSLPFWRQDIFEGVVKRLRPHGFVKPLVLVPLVLSQFIFSDLGVINGFGAFSMPMYKDVLVGLIGIAHAHSAGLVLFYVGLTLMEAMIYFYLVSLIGGFLLRGLRMMHLYPQG